MADACDNVFYIYSYADSFNFLEQDDDFSCFAFRFSSKKMRYWMSEVNFFSELLRDDIRDV